MLDRFASELSYFADHLSQENNPQQLELRRDFENFAGDLVKHHSEDIGLPAVHYLTQAVLAVPALEFLDELEHYLAFDCVRSCLNAAIRCIRGEDVSLFHFAIKGGTTPFVVTVPVFRPLDEAELAPEGGLGNLVVSSATGL